MEDQTNIAPAEDVANFLANWNPKGVTTADAAHLEGLAPLPVEKKAETTLVAEAKVEDKVPAAEVPAAEVKEGKKEESSLTSESKPAEPVKTWEELLAERSGGKFSKWEDLEKVINEPKVEFADDTVAKINEYIKQGGTYEDYVATQSVNFDKMTPTELIEYKIQMEDPDMTDEEVAYELKVRYGVDKWKANPADYDEGVEPEDIRMSRLKFNREALKTRDALKQEQAKWATPTKKEVKAPVIDPSIQKRWESEVTEAINKFEKVPLKISDNESYDYVVDASEKAELAKLTNELFGSTKGFFEQFTNKDGSFNKEAMTQAFFKMRNFDKAVAFAATQARAKGGESVVKEIKNIDFKPEGKSVEQKGKTTQDYIKEQALKIARGED